MAIPRHKRSNNSADNRPSKRPRPIQRGRAGGHLDHSKDSTPRRTRDSQRPSMPTPNQESHLESPPIDDDSDEFASFHHDGSDLDEDIDEDIEEHDRYDEDSDTTNPDIENTRERRLLEKHARSTNESHSHLQIETQVSPNPSCLNFCTKSSGSLALATKTDEATQHPQAQAQSKRQSILILYRSLVAPV